jgi:hypothetical protein
MGKDETGANPGYALLKLYIWTRMRRRQMEKEKRRAKMPAFGIFF